MYCHAAWKQAAVAHAGRARMHQACLARGLVVTLRASTADAWLLPHGRVATSQAGLSGARHDWLHVRADELLVVIATMRHSKALWSYCWRQLRCYYYGLHAEQIISSTPIPDPHTHARTNTDTHHTHARQHPHTHTHTHIQKHTRTQPKHAPLCSADTTGANGFSEKSTATACSNTSYAMQRLGSTSCEQRTEKHTNAVPAHPVQPFLQPPILAQVQV